MTRKRTAPDVSPPAAARSADLETRLAAAQARLRRALLEGVPTGAIRAVVAGLEGELEALAAAAEAERRALALAREARLDAAAAALGAGVAERLARRLAALEPPVPGAGAPVPSTVPFGAEPESSPDPTPPAVPHTGEPK